MRRLSLLLSMLCIGAGAQTYTTVSIAPNAAASAVGQLRFVEKSNSPTRKYWSIEGPDSLGANVRYKFDGTTTAGCLSLGALSGSVYPITTASCTGQWTTSGSDIYFSTGKVSIGTSTNRERLEVNGAVLIEGSTTIDATKVAGLYLQYGSAASALWSHDSGSGTTLTVGTLANNGLSSTSTIYASTGVVITAASSSVIFSTPTVYVQDLNVAGACTGCGVGQWTTSGSDIYFSTGKVSIGTSTNRERLEVNGAVLIEGSTTIDATKVAGLYLQYGSAASALWSHDSGSGTTLTVGTLANNGLSSTSTIYASTGVVITAASSSVIFSTPTVYVQDLNVAGACTGCGGGGSPVFDSGLVTGQSGSVTVNLTVSGGIAPAGYYRINAYLGCDVGHTSGASQADVFPLFARSSGSAFVESVTAGVNALRCGSATSGSAFEFVLPPMLVHTDGSAHLQFSTVAVGFASSQLYNYRVYLESF